ncbi:putative 60S ribosomal protein L4 [Helianthus debilis subsp. tardiflorus]
MKKNTLKNLNTMLRLNPYAKTAKRMVVLAEEQRKKAKNEKRDSKRQPISKVYFIQFRFVF